MWTTLLSKGLITAHLQIIIKIHRHLMSQIDRFLKMIWIILLCNYKETMSRLISCSRWTTRTGRRIYHRLILISCLSSFIIPILMRSRVRIILWAALLKIPLIWTLLRRKLVIRANMSQFSINISYLMEWCKKPKIQTQPNTKWAFKRLKTKSNKCTNKKSL